MRVLGTQAVPFQNTTMHVPNPCASRLIPRDQEQNHQPRTALSCRKPDLAKPPRPEGATEAGDMLSGFAQTQQSTGQKKASEVPALQVQKAFGSRNRNPIRKTCMANPRHSRALKRHVVADGNHAPDCTLFPQDADPRAPASYVEMKAETEVREMHFRFFGATIDVGVL